MCGGDSAWGGGVRGWVLGRRDEGDTPSSRTLTLPFTCGGRGTAGSEARRQVEWRCYASYSSPNRSTRIILFRRSGRAATRSYARIEAGDLEHLAALACQDREQFFSRRPRWGTLYADRMICVALCQGAALHFVNGENGVKDFDVWTFFANRPEAPFLSRRPVVHTDFGRSKFGRNPTEPPQYIGGG